MVNMIGYIVNMIGKGSTNLPVSLFPTISSHPIKFLTVFVYTSQIKYNENKLLTQKFDIMRMKNHLPINKFCGTFSMSFRQPWQW